MPPRKRAKKPPTEAVEAGKIASRWVRTVGRKVASGDPEDLAELLRLERAVHNAMHVAINGLRRSGLEMARVLGVTRQAVSQRFPR